MQCQTTMLSILIFFFCQCVILIRSDEASCPDVAWNMKNTDAIPYNDVHEQWISRNWSRRDNMYGAKMRLLNAYLYEDFIAVTTTVEYKMGRPGYCRYYDCNRQEIPGSTWKGVFFPLTTIYCVRRAGAKYISVSFEPTDPNPEPPIPLLFRAYETPVHELSMCVGPFYGTDKKWMQLIEFVEHYRANDVTMFYFTIFDMDSYSRTVMDEYQRMGLGELTVIQTEYKQLDWMFHLIQVHDCYHRSKYHSKWVINADIDERFTMLQPDLTLTELLGTLDESVGEVNFQARRIHKTEFSPGSFTTTQNFISNLEFLKFNKSVEHTWGSSKSIHRPEKVCVLTYHLSFLQYPGTIIKYLPKEVAEFRHYRITQIDNSIGNGWTDKEKVTEETWLEENLEEDMVHRVVNMIDHIYESEI